jgi:protein TonB
MTYDAHAPSRQITSAAAVFAVHAALLLALISGLAIRPTVSPTPPVQYVPLAPDEPVNPAPVDRSTNVDFDPMIVSVPEPVVDVEFEPDGDTIIAQPSDVDYSGLIEDGAMITQATPLRSDPLHPLAPPDYPASEIRKNHEGTVQLLIYVLPDGRVSDVKIGRSSGYPLLDDAALRKARSAWRFLPATSGSGQAIAAWGTFDVRFELR